MKAKLFTAAMSLCLSSVGCLSPPEGDREPTDSTCKNVSVCDALPLSDVNSVLRASFFDIEPWLDYASGPDKYQDSCRYAESDGSALVVGRTCYVNSGAASSRFEASRLEISPPNPPGARAEVMGVGDQAFFDDTQSSSADHVRAMLHVIQSNVVVDIDDTAVPVDENVQADLVVLANVVLALP